jgi:tetratricopeptide (TPR) repeat protein
MKAVLFAIVFFTAQNLVLGQPSGVGSNSLVFDHRYTQCERKWVVLSKNDTAQSYTYGFVYLDAHAGFTFITKGKLKINNAGRYLSDTSMFKGPYPRTRLPRNTANMALLPPEHFHEMHLDPLPVGMLAFYAYADTLEHNFHWGFVYNDLGQCDSALVYLNKVYRVQPHYKNVEFELIYAYNTLHDYDSAIKVMQGGMSNDPMNVVYYRELGYAYMQQKNYYKAIPIFKQGINLCTDNTQNNTKAEMAINLADVYKAMGAEELFKAWGKQAKIWASPGTSVYDFIVRRGF